MENEMENPALPLIGFPGTLPAAADFENFRLGELQRLMGFWILWHLYGGIDGLVHDAALMSQATCYRHMRDFRNRFSGIEVWELRPELSSHVVDPEAFYYEGNQA